jgi:1-acyl-sn-glycerol-3-phosphate acyltransferase
MKGLYKRPFRVLFRLCWLAGEISLALLDFVVNVMFQRQMALTKARPLWLQHACRRVLRILSVDVKTRGPIPLKGLLVCNHLSYLDVLVISSITPAVFIAKSEVKRWPVFGWFARMSGTLFVERSRRTDVSRLNLELARILDEGALVVLFPEGTSSDGSNVLPFKSSLLEPVTRLDQPLTIGCISYALADGRPGQDVCYWGEMTLFPHLVNLLSKRCVNATVAFTKVGQPGTCRKTLARHLHSEVVRLRDSDSVSITA